MFIDSKETAIEYLACDSTARFYSGETKWINKMRKYAEEYPEDVIITKDNEWGLMALIPKSWLKVSPPRKVALSEEQRRSRAETLMAARRKNGEQDSR